MHMISSLYNILAKDVVMIKCLLLSEGTKTEYLLQCSKICQPRRCAGHAALSRGDKSETQKYSSNCSRCEKEMGKKTIRDAMLFL